MANAVGEEFLIGIVPDADMSCEELQSGEFETPTWLELVNLLDREKIHLMEIVFMGCIYDSESHHAGSANGWSGVVEYTSVTRAPFASEKLQQEQGQIMPPVAKGFVKAVMSIEPGVNTPIFAHRLSLGATELHGVIVGIVVRKIS